MEESTDPTVLASTQLTVDDTERYRYYLTNGIDESQLPALDESMLEQVAHEDYAPRYVIFSVSLTVCDVATLLLDCTIRIELRIFDRN